MRNRRSREERRVEEGEKIKGEAMTGTMGMDYNAGAIFDNLPKLIRPGTLAEILGISKATIYDWKYRIKTRNIPEKLFLKISGRLYIRTDVLNDWLSKCAP